MAYSFPHPLHAVLFDMDGVLVDVSGSYHKAILATAQHFLGKAVPASAIEDFKSRGGFNNDWVLTHTLLAENGCDVPYEDVVARFQQLYLGDDFDGLITTEPPLIQTDTLRMLAGQWPLALVTGRPEPDAHWTLDRFGWSDFFSVVVGMEQQGDRGKPDPFPLHLACELLGSLAPSATIYVGDTIDDMNAATAAGSYPIGITPPYAEVQQHGARLRNAGAAIVLSSPDALPNLIGMSRTDQV